MTTTIERPGIEHSRHGRTGRWIEDWRPEDETIRAAAAVHDRGGQVRRPELDGVQHRATAGADGAGGDRPGTRGVVLDAAGGGGHRRGGAPPAGGRHLHPADRARGARFLATALGAGIVLVASIANSLPLFLVGFIALFVFSGVGNGSTYKMVPAIFRAKPRLLVADGHDQTITDREARRLAGALIGIAGAIGAFGGVLVTWFVCLRPSPNRLSGV